MRVGVLMQLAFDGRWLLLTPELRKKDKHNFLLEQMDRLSIHRRDE